MSFLGIRPAYVVAFTGIHLLLRKHRKDHRARRWEPTSALSPYCYCCFVYPVVLPMSGKNAVI